MPIVKNTDTLKAAKAAYATMSATPTAPTQTDAQLFSALNNLFGDPLLSLAERYSDKTIAERVNGNGNASEPAVTVGAIDQRVKGALKQRAKLQGITFAAAKAAHDQLRFAAGVKDATRTGRGRANQQKQAAMKASSSLSAPTIEEDEEDEENEGDDGGEEDEGEEDEEAGGEEEIEEDDKDDAFVDSSKAQ